MSSKVPWFDFECIDHLLSFLKWRFRKEKKSKFHTTRHLHFKAGSDKVLNTCNTFSGDFLVFCSILVLQNQENYLRMCLQ